MQHREGVGHIGESHREDKLVAIALCLKITSLSVHCAQLGSGVVGNMAWEG